MNLSFQSNNTAQRNSQKIPLLSYKSSQDAFEALYNLYAAPLFGTIIKWKGDQPLAQMILRQTFTTYIKQGFTDSETRPFISLLKIARKIYNQETNTNLLTPLHTLSMAQNVSGI